MFYSGTFSKVLLPSIRLAYLVVPETQVERFEQITEALAGGSPELTQAIVTAFITEGTSPAISSGCGSSMPSVGKRQRQACKACSENTCELIRSQGECT